MIAPSPPHPPHLLPRGVATGILDKDSIDHGPSPRGTYITSPDKINSIALLGTALLYIVLLCLASLFLTLLCVVFALLCPTVSCSALPYHALLYSAFALCSASFSCALSHPCLARTLLILFAFHVPVLLYISLLLLYRFFFALFCVSLICLACFDFACPSTGLLGAPGVGYLLLTQTRPISF